MLRVVKKGSCYATVAYLVTALLLAAAALATGSRGTPQAEPQPRALQCNSAGRMYVTRWEIYITLRA